MVKVWRPHYQESTEVINMEKNIVNHSAHSTWRCQYHIVFAPKYRRMAIFGQIQADIGKILRQLCQQKGVEIIEAYMCPDHVHMLLEIPPKMSVSGVMVYIQGKSILMIYERWGSARFQYRNREFWCRGYYVDTTGKNTQKIKEYIANQLREDQLNGQLTMEDVDPFTGSK